MAAFALIATATTFLPWGRSGSRSRSSYDIVDVAGRADVLPTSMASLAPAWFLIPVLCGLVLLAVAARRVRLAAAGAATLGALVTAGGVLVARSPLVTEPGAIIGSVAGGSTVLAGAVVLITTSIQGGFDERRMGSRQR